jgi:molybdopterin converting factor small subunit
MQLGGEMGIRINIDKSVLSYGKGNVVVEVSGNTIGECLNRLVKRRPALKKAIFDENGRLYADNLIKVNGEYISSNHLDKSVKDGDQIEIIKYTGG